MEGQNSIFTDGYHRNTDKYRYLHEVSSSLVVFLFSFGKRVDKNCSTYTDTEFIGEGERA